MLLQPEHGADAERYSRSAVSALRTCSAIFGLPDDPTLTLVDPDATDAPTANQSGAAMPSVHWWTTKMSMAPELAAARGVSRRLVAERLAGSAIPAWFADGLAEAVARRAVVPLFEKEYLLPGFAFVEERYFGGLVPRAVRMRLIAETDGAPVSAYRRNLHVAMRNDPPPDDVEALAGKTVVALATLERWVGRPTLDAVLDQLFAESTRHAVTIADLERLASATSGQDLRWFFDPVFRSSAVFDYAVARLATERAADGSFTTSVIVQRNGDGQFTGAAAPRVGRFESGRGIAVQVSFADGERRVAYWDGRDRAKTLQYRSPAPATSAIVDPDGVLLLDLAQTNNSATLAPAGDEPVRWASRFQLWVINALLTYASLV